MKPVRVLLAIAVVGCSSVVAAGNPIKVSNPAFREGGNIPSKFTCDGSNTSPALKLEGVPPAAKGLVLIVDDPDVPGGLFTHWIVWNIDPSVTSIAEGKAPPGSEGRNGFGKSGYGGPCPPSGAHRYYFRVFALDQQLSLPAGSQRKQLDGAMKGHVIAEGELMGRYARQK